MSRRTPSAVGSDARTSTTMAKSWQLKAGSYFPCSFCVAICAACESLS
jgi:hypothetical protein